MDVKDNSNESKPYIVEKKLYNNQLGYVNLSPVYNVIGYVVNTHSSLDYDIHLFFPNEMIARRYQSCFKKYYYYRDTGSEIVKQGIAHRCRLKGIKVIKNHSEKEKEALDRKDKREKKKNRSQYEIDAHIMMLRRIDILNGWVICDISNIDIYQRILVSVRDVITKEDFGQILMKNFPQHYALY